MADTKTFRFILDSDSKPAIAGLGAFSTAAKKADTSVKDLITKVDKLDGQTATMVLSVKAADVQSKLGDVLQQITALDTKDPVIDVKLAEASSLKGDLDSIEAKVKSLNGTPIDIDTRAARTGLDDVGRSAGSSRSVLANMVGNATQDLGVLGGVAGSAGVAIGQMGEYMADALGEGEKLTSVIGSFAKVAGPIAAVAVVTAVATTQWSNYKQAQAEAAKSTEDAVKALDEVLGLTDKLKNVKLAEPTTAAEAFNRALITNDSDRSKAIQSFGVLNVESDKLGTTMIALERDARATLTTLAEGAGVPADIADKLGQAVSKTENFTDATRFLVETYGPEWFDIINKYKGVTKALEELNDQQQKNDTVNAAQQFLNARSGADTATAALVRQAEATAKAKNANADAVDILNEYIKSSASATAATDYLSNAVAANSAGMLRAHDATIANAKAMDDGTIASDFLTKSLERQQQALLGIQTGMENSHDLALASQQADLDAADAIDKYNTSLSGRGAASKDVSAATKDLADAQEKYNKSLEVTPSSDLDIRSAQLDLADAQAKARAVRNDYHATDLDKQKALLAVDKAQEKLNKTLAGTSDTADQQASALKAVQDAQERLAKASQPPSQGDVQQDYIKTQQTIDDTASKYGDYVVNQVEGTGRVLTELEKLQIHRDAEIVSLDKQRDTVKPGSPLYQAVSDYIDLLKTIPTTITSDITVSGNAAGALIGKKALGGPVRKGDIDLIGENGIEVYESTKGRQLIGVDGPGLFIVPDDGRIIPNDKIVRPGRAIRSAAARTSGGTARGVTSNIGTLAASYADESPDSSKTYKQVTGRLAGATSHVAGSVTKQAPDFWLTTPPTATAAATRVPDTPTPSPGLASGRAAPTGDVHFHMHVDPAADQAAVGRAIEAARAAWLRSGGRAA